MLPQRRWRIEPFSRLRQGFSAIEFGDSGCVAWVLGGASRQGTAGAWSVPAEAGAGLGLRTDKVLAQASAVVRNEKR